MSDQIEIAWEDVAPVIDTEGFPSEEAWVHSDKCRCGGCRERASTLLMVRRWMMAMRCEAERIDIQNRILYYRKRARRKLPLFEPSPKELRAKSENPVKSG